MLALHLLAIVVIFLPLTEAISPDVCNVRCAICDHDRCRECYYGWYGHNCNSECQNCWTSGCHKHSGKCVQCKPGRYLEDCGTPCPNNCRAISDTNDEVHCRRENGTCLNGCKVGWWGYTCNRRCSEHCKSGACLQNSGHCIDSCLVGWWGTSCNKICSQRCRNSRCQCLSGKCIDGCMNGRHGAYCQKACPAGCINSLCKWENGECILGCTRSLYGNDCTKECSVNCKDRMCDVDGRCMRGCIDGFSGRTCHKPCPINCLTCDQEVGICKTCKTDWIGKHCRQQRMVMTIDPTEPQPTSIAGNAGHCADTMWKITLISFSLALSIYLRLLAI